jgi:hypothetical protein
MKLDGTLVILNAADMSQPENGINTRIATKRSRRGTIDGNS